MSDFSSCTYVDDLTIAPTMLTTLCLLYDKISLPHPYEHDPDCEAIMNISFENERLREKERYAYATWKNTHKELLSRGVVEILPPPIAVKDMQRDLENRLTLQIGRNPYRLSTSDVLDGKVALAVHALYAKPNSPEFATSYTLQKSTPEISVAFASLILNQSFPILPKITPEQILEVRERTAGVKDGFRLYLASLADDVEARIGGGSRTLGLAVENSYMRKIEPQLEEYFRRELPDKIKWLSTFALALTRSGGDLVQIVLQPWSIGNYRKLIDGIAGFAKDAADRSIRRASNEQIAYQFIGKLRKEAHRLGATEARR